MKDRGIAPELQPGDIECLKDAKPDFIAMNYYSTATIAASRGDASDVAARQVISRLCWENRGISSGGKSVCGKNTVRMGCRSGWF